MEWTEKLCKAMAGNTALVSLELSHNKLCDLAALLPKLAALPKLKHLYLDGNPFCLRKQYRAAVIAALPELTMLDGVEVDVDQKELAEAYAAPEPDPPPAPPAPEEGEEAAPAPEAPARRVPVLAGLGSDAVELTVGLSAAAIPRILRRRLAPRVRGHATRLNAS